MDTCTVNPLLIPLGGLFISNLFEGGLIETGGLFGRREGGGLIYFRKNNGISCPQRTRTQSGEAQEQNGWSSCNRESESNPNFQLVNKPSWISLREVLEGRGGHINFLPLKKGGLVEDLLYLPL